MNQEQIDRLAKLAKEIAQNGDNSSLCVASTLMHLCGFTVSDHYQALEHVSEVANEEAQAWMIANDY